MNYRKRQKHVVVKWHRYFEKWRKVLCGYKVRFVRTVTKYKTTWRGKPKLVRSFNALLEGSNLILNHH